MPGPASYRYWLSLNKPNEDYLSWKVLIVVCAALFIVVRIVAPEAYADFSKSAEPNLISFDCWHSRSTTDLNIALGTNSYIFLCNSIVFWKANRFSITSLSFTEIMPLFMSVENSDFLGCFWYSNRGLPVPKGFIW